jgi:hypothetical protein
MTLEERKAFRREMLYQAIRQSMKSLEVVSSLYKFKIINLDARHHRFLALIEVATSFKARKGSKPQTFPQIEAFLRDNAFEHFGLVLERVSGASANQRRTSSARSGQAIPPRQPPMPPRTPLAQASSRPMIRGWRARSLPTSPPKNARPI